MVLPCILQQNTKLEVRADQNPLLCDTAPLIQAFIANVESQADRWLWPHLVCAADVVVPSCDPAQSLLHAGNLLLQLNNRLVPLRQPLVRVLFVAPRPQTTTTVRDVKKRLPSCCHCRRGTMDYGEQTSRTELGAHPIDHKEKLIALHR